MNYELFIISSLVVDYNYNIHAKYFL